MAFNATRAAVWRDPLGPSRLNSSLDSLSWLRNLYARQHIVAGSTKGQHNAWETPRVSRRITFGGGTATLGNTSTDITAVGNPATGTLTLTLASGRFTANMRLQVTAAAADGNKPRIAMHRVISATSVEVYLKELSSALGGGNAWAAVNGAVDVAIHDAPLVQAAWPNGPSGATIGASTESYPPGVLRGDFLAKQKASQGVTRGFWWDDYAYHHATLRDSYLVEHTTAGEHNSINIGRTSLLARWRPSGSVFDVLLNDGNTVTVTNISTGIVQLDFASAVTAAQSYYIAPDWTRGDRTLTAPGTMLAVNPLTNSTTRTTLYGFAHLRGPNVWDRARFDFYMVFHSA
jgi:hypothetical protein